MLTAAISYFRSRTVMEGWARKRKTPQMDVAAFLAELDAAFVVATSKADDMKTAKRVDADLVCDESPEEEDSECDKEVARITNAAEDAALPRSGMRRPAH